MKIRLAILDKDKDYLDRIVGYYNTKYADKLEIFTYTDYDSAIAGTANERINVLLADDYFDIDVSRLQKKCGFAYLSESGDAKTSEGCTVISKYRKPDLIYSQIYKIFVETSRIAEKDLSNGETRVFLFASPCGGCGSSSMAAACAAFFAEKGKRVLYINLERFGSTELYFSADGDFSIGDIVYAIKCNKTNIGAMVDAYARQDECGVYFLNQSELALDVMELNNNDIVSMIEDIKMSGNYNVVVLDMDFSMTDGLLLVLDQADEIIWTSDGTVTANTKVFRAFNAISILEEKSEEHIIDKISLVYNRFSNSVGKTLSGIGINQLGGTHWIKNASPRQIIFELSKTDVFTKLKS